MNSEAKVCPICKGTGKYKEYINYNNVTYVEKCCHSCKGTGWIQINDYRQFPDWKNHITYY